VHVLLCKAQAGAEHIWRSLLRASAADDSAPTFAPDLLTLDAMQKMLTLQRFQNEVQLHHAQWKLLTAAVTALLHTDAVQVWLYFVHRSDFNIALQHPGMDFSGAQITGNYEIKRISICSLTEMNCP